MSDNWMRQLSFGLQWQQRASCNLLQMSSLPLSILTASGLCLFQHVTYGRFQLGRRNVFHHARIANANRQHKAAHAADVLFICAGGRNVPLPAAA